jgi:hypothetical protein
MSRATIIMISSLLEDSSDGSAAISAQMITEITYKIHNLEGEFKKINVADSHNLKFRAAADQVIGLHLYLQFGTFQARLVLIYTTNSLKLVLENVFLG